MMVLWLALFVLIAGAEPAAAAPVLGVLTAFASKVFASVTLKAVAMMALRTVLLAGVSLLLQKWRQRKQRPAGLQTSVTTVGGTDPQGTIVGLYASAGHLVYRNGHGDNNRYLTHVIEVSDVPGVGFSRLIIDGEYSDLGPTAHADYGFPILTKNDGRHDRGWVRFVDGTHSAADPGLMAKYAADPDRPWTSNHILSGIAHFILTFDKNREVYPNWPPQVRFELIGIPLYDPRLDGSVGGSGAHRWGNPGTWITTTNPMVIAYNIKRGIALPDGSTWGGAAEADDLPLGSWTVAMNVCDQSIGTPPRTRFQCGFEIRFNEEPADVLEEIYASANAQVSELGGVWRVQVGAPSAAIVQITDDDIIVTESQQFDPFPGAESTFNAISVSHPARASLWSASGLGTITNAAWEAEDGAQRLFDLKLPAVPWRRQARQLARNLIRDQRRFRTHAATLPPEFFHLEPLDTIEWSSAWNSYSSKSFGVTQIAYDLRTLTTAIAIRELDPSDFNYDPSLELPDPPVVTGGLVFTDVGVPGFAAIGVTLLDGAGTARRVGLRAVWSTQIAGTVDGITLQLRLAGTTELVGRSGVSPFEDGEFLFSPLLPNTAYEVRARSMSRRRKTTWTVWLSVTTDDIRLAPGDLSQAVWDAIAADATGIATGLDALVIEDLELQAVQQRSVSGALGVIDGHILWMLGKLSETTGLVRGAGIYVDPADGTVRIAAVDGQAHHISEAEIRLDAAEANINLRATHTDVSMAVSAAMLDPTSLPIVGALRIQVTQVEVDLNALAGTVALKASTTTVNGIDTRLGTAEVKVNSLEGSIIQKVNQTDFDAVETRVGSAEVAITALDGPAITQTVADTRYLFDQDSIDVATDLAALLAAYEDRTAARRDLAYATSDMRALVDEDRVAVASIETQLGAAIDGNLALIETERSVRAGETGVLTQDIVTLDAQLLTVDGTLAAMAGTLTAQGQAQTALTSRVTNNEGVITAQGQAHTALTTTVGGNTASILGQATSINGVMAEQAFNLDINGHISGLILRSEMHSGGVVASAAFVADKFAIVGTGANPVTPFVVYTAPRTVGGQVLPAGVYMENVAIGRARIGRAQITNILQSDNYAQDAQGQPTAGMRLNFNTGSIKTANAVISRNIVAATGQFDPGVIAINRAAGEHLVRTWSMVETGIMVSVEDVWTVTSQTYLAKAAFNGSSTVIGAAILGSEVWYCRAEVLHVARWHGPQQLRLKIELWADGISALHSRGDTALPGEIRWTVYKVT